GMNRAWAGNQGGEGVRRGMAMPLALAALVGVGLGRWAPSGLFEFWSLCLLFLFARGEWRAVALGAVIAFSASQVLLAKGAVLPDGLLRADLALEGRIESVEEEGKLSRLMVRVDACRP